MSNEKTSPKAAKVRTPLQKELMHVIKGRVAKGLAADISPEEDDSDNAAEAASGSDEDILTELNSTLKFKKKEDGHKQPLRANPAPAPNVGRPSDSEKAANRKLPVDIHPTPAVPQGKNTFGPAEAAGRKSQLTGRLDSAPASAVPQGKNTFGPAEAAGRKSPLTGLLDSAPASAVPKGKNTFGPAEASGRKSPLTGLLDSAARKAPASSLLLDGTGRKSPHDSHFDAVVGDRRPPREPLQASGSSGQKSPLDGIADSPGKKSLIHGSAGGDAGGRQSPLEALLDLKRSRQSAAAMAASPAAVASQRTSAPSPTQLSDASPRGSEPSSARQTPRDWESGEAAAASPRLKPLMVASGLAAAKGGSPAAAAATKGELTTKQKEDIIFGRSSGSQDAKNTSTSDKPAVTSANKLASIFGVGDSKKTAQPSKSPRSELDALLADEKPSKEEAKAKEWKPPQFKTLAATTNEEGRKTPTGQQQAGTLLGPDAGAASRDPKPKPRGINRHPDEQGASGNNSPAIPDISGRSTPSSLGRLTPGSGAAVSDAGTAEHARRTGKPNQRADGRKEGQFGSGHATPVADDAIGRRVAAGTPPSPAVDIFGRNATKSPAQPADARSNASVGSGRASPAAASAMARSQLAAVSAAAPEAKKHGGSAATAARSAGNKEERDAVAGGRGFVAKLAAGSGSSIAAVASSQPGAGKKGYLQSLLGTTADGDGEDGRGAGRDDGGRTPENQSYLHRLLQQPKTPVSDEKSVRLSDRAHESPAHSRKTVARRSVVADEDRDSDDSERAIGPPAQHGARRMAPRDADLDEADDSSVCYDVLKDPSQLAREKAEREARFQRFGKKQMTEKQENEMRIYEVADAQSSAMLRPIEPDTAAATYGGPGGKKAPVKPKARYAQSGDSQSPTSSTLSRSFDSTNDIRQFIYDEWKRAKSAQVREERKARALKEKEEEEKKRREEAEKLSSSKASYNSWKEAKAVAQTDAAKSRKDEERKKEDEEKKKAEEKAAAQLAFRRWKEEKDEHIKASLMKSMKEKQQKEKESKEEQKAKTKDCTTAFTGWKAKKDEKLKQTLTEEETQKKAEQEAKRQAQQESEKVASELYRQWIHKKEQQKEKERKLCRERKLQELENPRPAWSPPNKTVPHMR